MVEKKLPLTVAERLKQVTIDSEFSRTPLEEAFAYIGKELDIQVVVDGDALKAAGFTKNMPQTFNLGKVPAVQAVAKILSNYEKEKIKIKVSVDEVTKTLHVSTDAVLNKEGKKIFDVGPAPK